MLCGEAAGPKTLDDVAVLHVSGCFELAAPFCVPRVWLDVPALCCVGESKRLLVPGSSAVAGCGQPEANAMRSPLQGNCREQSSFCIALKAAR